MKMIHPHPESDLNLNIMVLGAEIIQILRLKKGYVLVERVMEDFLQADHKRTPDMFMHSLVFLFIFDLIDEKDFRIKIKQRKWHNLTLNFDF